MFDIFKKDPEIERVCERLSKRLDNIDEWKPDDASGWVKHKTYNIEASHCRMLEPEWVNIPFRWHRRLRKKINAIWREHEVEKLGFIYDILDGKYIFQVITLSAEQKAWLDENATEDQYIIRKCHLYISDETLAMAYKLRWL